MRSEGAVSTIRPIPADGLASDGRRPGGGPPKDRSGGARSAGPAPTFEQSLWQTADALRNNMDAAEYKHVVLGLIFLKYISDAFEAKHQELDSQHADGADPEDPDEYRAASIFWVPPEARWEHLKASAPQPTIGTMVDDAMTAIERDNPSLKGVLPKDYARPGLDKQRLGQIINLVSDIALGAPADRSKDTLGRVYEYFLARSAIPSARGSPDLMSPTSTLTGVDPLVSAEIARIFTSAGWVGIES